jgi:hypothetical protein
MLSASSLLLSAFASGPRLSVNGPWNGVCHLCFLLSAFCFVSLVSAYLLAVVAASLHTAWRTAWRLLPVLPLVFAGYHIGYGYGFLRGVWDFFIRPRQSQSGFERLTR